MSGLEVQAATKVRLASSPLAPDMGAGRVFSHVATVLELAGIVVLALLGYLLGAGQYDLLTDDEIRYAEAGRQMLRSGDWVVPIYNGEPRFQKPLLVYWLQAISQGVFGNHSWAARVPSALAAIVALVSTWTIARTVWDATTARWAVLVLGTMLEFILLARMVLIDMLLVASLQVSGAAILSAWRSNSTRTRFLCYQLAGLALGLAICAKGPLAVLLLALFVLPLSLAASRQQIVQADSSRDPHRQGRSDIGQYEVGREPLSAGLRCYLERDWLGLLTGGLLAAMVGLWSYLLPHWRTHGAFTWQFLITENWERFTRVINEHPQPVWFYVALLLPLSFPWTGAVPFALFHAWRAGRDEDGRFVGANAAKSKWPDAFARATLLHVGLVFAFFSLSRTKVWTYTFPALPSLALLIAHWLVSQQRRQPQQLHRCVSLALTVGVVVCLAAALVVTAWPESRLPEEVRDVVFLFAVRSWAWLLVGMLILCWWLSRMVTSAWLTLGVLIVGTVGWYAVAVYYVLPTADRMWNEPVRLVARLWQQYPEAEVITYHVHELGLNFHARRDLVHHWRNEALPDLYERLRHPRPVLVLVDAKLRHHLRGLPIYVWDENNRFGLLANIPSPLFPQVQANQLPIVADEEPTVRHSR